MNLPQIINNTYQVFLSEKRKNEFEKVIFLTAIVTFVIHFMLVLLISNRWIEQDIYPEAVAITDPIYTIYTPFTIILLYEIYLLIYYLPKSITYYLGKQYEIVTLIIIRGLFDKLGRLSIGTLEFTKETIMELLILFGGLLLLLLLIICFYKFTEQMPVWEENKIISDTPRYQYILIKKVIALGLLGLFAILFIQSFLHLPYVNEIRFNDVVSIIKDLNTRFFGSFFTALILTEVLLLLFMYNIDHRFNKVIRNSGFVISTILLKLSFRTEGVINLFIILVAVTFGVAISGIYNLSQKKKIKSGC